MGWIIAGNWNSAWNLADSEIGKYYTLPCYPLFEYEFKVFQVVIPRVVAYEIKRTSESSNRWTRSLDNWHFSKLFVSQFTPITAFLHRNPSIQDFTVGWVTRTGPGSTVFVEVHRRSNFKNSVQRYIMIRSALRKFSRYLRPSPPLPTITTLQVAFANRYGSGAPWLIMRQTASTRPISHFSSWW